LSYLRQLRFYLGRLRVPGQPPLLLELIRQFKNWFGQSIEKAVQRSVAQPSQWAGAWRKVAKPWWNGGFKVERQCVTDGYERNTICSGDNGRISNDLVNDKAVDLVGTKQARQISQANGNTPRAEINRIPHSTETGKLTKFPIALSDGRGRKLIESIASGGKSTLLDLFYTVCQCVENDLVSPRS
jgi:hypothetical protein